MIDNQDEATAQISALSFQILDTLERDYGGENCGDVIIGDAIIIAEVRRESEDGTITFVHSASTDDRYLIKRGLVEFMRDVLMVGTEIDED